MNDSNVVTSNIKKVHSDKIFIDVEDIEKLTGRSKRQSYRYIEQIKDYFNKKSHQRLTILEVNEYFGITQNC
jgi:hypothetical protein